MNLELSESAEASEGRSNRLNNRDLRDRNDAAFVSSFTAILQHVSDTLQALVYDILPSTSAVFSYVIGSKKLSANEQVFFFFLGGGGWFVVGGGGGGGGGAQTVVRLLQTTQIMSDVCSITDHVAYASSNKPNRSNGMNE